MIVENIDLSLNFSDDELNHMGMVAKKQGYMTLKDYMLDLIADDEAEGFEEETDDEILARIESSLYQAMTGQVVPLESLWDDDEEDD